MDCRYFCGIYLNGTLILSEIYMVRETNANRDNDKQRKLSSKTGFFIIIAWPALKQEHKKA